MRGRCEGRKAIRKSGALDSIARTLLLKCVSTILTTFSAFHNAGIELGLSICGALAFVIIMFFLSTFIFSPLAEEVQKRKSERDDAV